MPFSLAIQLFFQVKNAMINDGRPRPRPRPKSILLLCEEESSCADVQGVTADVVAVVVDEDDTLEESEFIVVNDPGPVDVVGVLKAEDVSRVEG